MTPRLYRMVAALAIVTALLVLAYRFRPSGQAVFLNPPPPGSTDIGAAAYEGVKPVEARDGALSWQEFAAVREITREEKDKDGFINYELRPGFTPQMRNHDGKTVRLLGFIFPLSTGEKQKRFLFGPYPLSCPYHYHAANNQIVLVNPATPVPMSLNPVLLEGTLKLHETHPDMVFYTLEKATVRKEYR